MTEAKAQKVQQFLESFPDVHIRGEITQNYGIIAASAHNKLKVLDTEEFGFRTGAAIPDWVIEKMKKELGFGCIISPTVSEHGYVAQILFW